MKGDSVSIVGGFTVLKKRREGRVNYIVINTNKRYDKGHTHLNNYKDVMFVIDSVNRKRVPRNMNNYLLVSLIRVTDDEEYANKVQELIDTRKRKGKKAVYVNQGGRKR